MKISATLNRYLARAFFMNFLFMLGILLGMIYLFDTVELLRRAGKQEGISLSVVLQMGFLKLPEVGQTILPFAVLFSAMFTFWQLNRRNELIVMRSAGFSVWQFLAPVFSIAVITGVLYLSLINPIGAAMLGRFAALEDRLLFHRTSSVTLLKEGLWLRQDLPDGQVILHADRVDLPEWVLHDVMVLFFRNDDGFARRIDAPVAHLQDGKWVFEDAISNRPGTPAEAIPTVSLPTDLTQEEIEESFSSPSTVSFWQLPGFIQTMEATGFDATPLRIYFHSLLAQPLTFAAMILVAAVVSLRPPRNKGAFIMVMAGVACGFVVFFLASFLQALGASHQIPAVAAAWITPVVASLLGIAVMLNFEDG